MVAVPPAEEGSVAVVVRVRPQTPREQEANRQSIVQVVGDSMLVFDPEDSNLPGIPVSFQAHDPASRKKGKNLIFAFDRVFGETATQVEVFENTTKEILDGVLNGYNCSVFAYGATGAGKTHTMLGSEKEPGIMYLTMQELYKKIEARKEEKHCEVLISYQEVYNEQIHDLLEPKGPLAIREDPEKGVMVHGLSFHQPKTAAQLLEMLRKGNLNRTQHPTDINATSSRSHAIFQIYVKQEDHVRGTSSDFQVAKMSLIDLAGSERASVANTKGERLREGANINRSLLALINVINSLADAKSKKNHIPYRNSKLTRLLKDSIGGNCRTIMIAAISPSALSYEDTYNTLKYANRAKEIKLLLKSNVVSPDYSLSQYAVICEQLRAEVADLRGKLQTYEKNTPDVNSNVLPILASSSSEQQDELLRVKAAALSSEVLSKRECETKELLQILKQNDGTSCIGENHVEQMNQLYLCFHKDKVVLCTDILSKVVLAFHINQDIVLPTLAPNLSTDTKCRMHTLDIRRALAFYLQRTSGSRHSERLFEPRKKLGCSDMGPSNPVEQQEKLNVWLQGMDKKQLERLAIAILCVAQRQYTLLKAANLLTPDMRAEFEELDSLVQQGSYEAHKVSMEEQVKLFTSNKAIHISLHQNAEQLADNGVLPASYSIAECANPVGSPGASPVSLEILPVPSPPFKTPALPTKKRRKSTEHLSLAEKNTPSSPKGRAKRRRKASPSAQQLGSLKEWTAFVPVDSTSTPIVGKKSPSPTSCLSSQPCPSTVTKSRVPLGTSAGQNCSTPVPLRSLNTTFDLGEDPCPSDTKLSAPAWESVQHFSHHKGAPLIPSSASHSLGAPRSRIARLRGSSVKSSQAGSTSANRIHVGIQPIDSFHLLIFVQNPSVNPELDSHLAMSHGNGARKALQFLENRYHLWMRLMLKIP
ncbi:hypothetical protein JD844_002267 [Phrynosoma platyrhinos]|uniref:Kinesin-like protein n=1 Tax=Phrynosoma platyrhinos TaxID=52577 RepID=A0ABQ7TBA5_PHRPL|nr:hypothetical protein JD844_002267 [Phrynosoma platyrhinos]